MRPGSTAASGGVAAWAVDLDEGREKGERIRKNIDYMWIPDSYAV